MIAIREIRLGVYIDIYTDMTELNRHSKTKIFIGNDN